MRDESTWRGAATAVLVLVAACASPGEAPADGGDDAAASGDAGIDACAPGDCPDACVPTITACPATGACGALDDGCGTAIDCGPCGVVAYIRGDFVTRRVFDVGAYDTTTGAVPALGLSGVDFAVSSVAVSPSGDRLAVSGFASGSTSSDRLRVYVASDPQSFLTVVDASGTGHLVEIQELRFSPDGTRVAFSADIDVNGRNALYVVPADGSAPARRLSPVPEGTGRVWDILWVDDETVAYDGEMVQARGKGLWTVDVTEAVPAPVALVPLDDLPLGHQVLRNQLALDAQGRIYFVGDLDVDELQRLYRVAPDGTDLEQVPGTAVQLGAAEASIATWGISPDGTRLAFATWAWGQVGQVHVVDLAGPATPRAVTSFVGSPAPGPSQTYGATYHAISWSPDQTLLAFGGDWPLGAGEADNMFATFVAPVDGTSAVRITRPAVPAVNKGFAEARFTADGARLLIRGNLVAADEVELFSTADVVTPEQPAAALQLVDVPAGGNVNGLVIAP